MSQELVSVLQELEYQLLKTITFTPTERQLVEFAQGLLQEAIDSGDIIVDNDMPTTILGCALDWSAGSANDSIVAITKGSSTVTQDLESSTDSAIASSGYQELGFSGAAGATETGLSDLIIEEVQETFNTATTSYTSIAMLDSTRFVIAYTDAGNSGYGTAMIGTISGSTITYGSGYVFSSSATSIGVVAIIDSTHFVVAYRDDGGGTGTAIIGVTDGGDTISSFGSANTFINASTNDISVAVIDSTHFVVVYRDYGNSDYGTARVGLVSGTTISSYGAANVFNSAKSVGNKISILDSTHFVVAYTDQGNSDYGTAIIGVTDGATTISSYGTAVVYNSAATFHNSVEAVDSTHFVVAYQDQGNNSYGTARIGLTNGATTISSYGAENVFNSDWTYSIFVEALDSTHFAAAYRNGGSGMAGTVVIGLTNGATTISSYVPANVFNSAGSPAISMAAIDASNFVISYMDQGNSNYGTASLLKSSTYYFKANVDGAGESEYNITIISGTTYTDVLTLMNAATTAGATWSVIDGDLRCASDATGASSTIALAAGTTGTDLFFDFTEWTTFDAAVVGG